MISSRAQFGVFGAVIPLVLVIVMYLGFAATGTVLAGQAVDQILHIGTPAVGMVIFGALTVLVATLGYKYIHCWAVSRPSSASSASPTWASGSFASYDVGARARRHAVRVPHVPAGHLAGRRLAADLRPVRRGLLPLPAARRPRSATTFLVAFSGTVLGSQWSMTFGALFARRLPKATGSWTARSASSATSAAAV